MNSRWVCKASAVHTRLSDGQGRQYRLGDRDLIGFLVHAHLPERFLAVMGTRSASRWGAVCSPNLAPRPVFPTRCSRFFACNEVHSLNPPSTPHAKRHTTHTQNTPRHNQRPGG